MELKFMDTVPTIYWQMNWRAASSIEEPTTASLLPASLRLVALLEAAQCMQAPKCKPTAKRTERMAIMTSMANAIWLASKVPRGSQDQVVPFRKDGALRRLSCHLSTHPKGASKMENHTYALGCPADSTSDCKSRTRYARDTPVRVHKVSRAARWVDSGRRRVMMQAGLAAADPVAAAAAVGFQDYSGKGQAGPKTC
eukprot:990419-Pelagomonas_calceolata.AAC.1